MKSQGIEKTIVSEGMSLEKFMSIPFVEMFLRNCLILFTIFAGLAGTFTVVWLAVWIFESMDGVTKLFVFASIMIMIVALVITTVEYAIKNTKN